MFNEYHRSIRLRFFKVLSKGSAISKVLSKGSARDLIKKKIEHDGKKPAELL